MMTATDEFQTESRDAITSADPIGDAVRLDEIPVIETTPPPEPEPVPILARTLPVLAILLLAGTIALVFAFKTVHRRKPEDLSANYNAARSHFSITHWLEHGYFRSGGLAVRPWYDKSPFYYRSSTGGVLLSGFLVEKLYSGITGRYSWRLLALHNQVFSLLTATLIALLGFRLARRLGASPLHALALAISVQFVHFTFPDNLMVYWEMSGRQPWLFFAAIFLLLEERAFDRRTRSLTIAQGVSAFFLTYMEFVAGVAFIASYVTITVLLSRDRAVWKRLILMSVLPALLALGVFRIQLKWVYAKYPNQPIVGTGFLNRSGLDGSSEYYVDHLDIAYRRDLARANFNEQNRAHLFRWRWLFFAGVAAMIGIFVGAMRSRIPKIVVVALMSLLGAYLLYAAFFSQAVVIHPYLYDVMLFTPLAIAVFIVVPSFIESVTGRQGLAAIITVFLAIWVSMVQLRDYALRYPIPAKVSAVAHAVHLLS